MFISDIVYIVAIYNTATMSYEVWDGSLTVGGVTIGVVDQGAPGASAWKVDGSAVTQPVSGTFFQATQPVSVAGSVAVTGPLTDAQLRATPVPVTTTPSGTQNVDPVANTIGLATGAKQDTGNTSVASIDTKTPALGQALDVASVPVVLTAAQVATLTPVAGLTDAQLRATPVPVSGTVAVSTGYVVRLDEASSVITYVGYAVPTTATSAASWSIKRLDATTGLVVLWAAGTAAFTQIWDNRSGLAYS